MIFKNYDPYTLIGYKSDVGKKPFTLALSYSSKMGRQRSGDFWDWGSTMSTLKFPAK